MRNKEINSNQQQKIDDNSEPKITKMEVNLTHSLKKDLGFIGVIQQIFGVLGFIGTAVISIYLIIFIFTSGKMLKYQPSIIFLWVIGVVAVACIFMISKYLFSSGSLFKLAVLTYDGRLLEEAINKFAKYWKWNIIYIILILILWLVSVGITIIHTSSRIGYY